MLCYCYSKNTLSHRKAIQKWLVGRFMQSQTQWYIDKQGLDTPELKQMMKDLNNTNPKTVVVYSLSQLSTSLPKSITFLIGFLKNNGRIVAIEPQVDISGPAAADLLFALSKLNDAAQRERQAAGIEEAKQRGVYKGRKKGALKPGIDLQHVKALRKQGLSYPAIAKELGVARTTVIKYLLRV